MADVKATLQLKVTAAQGEQQSCNLCGRAGNNRFARQIDSIGRIECTLSSICLYGFSCKSLDTMTKDMKTKTLEIRPRNNEI